MSHEKIKKLKQEWLDKEKEKINDSEDKKYLPKRTYKHFDSNIGELSRKKAEQICWNKNKVKSHAFYPFLGFTKKTRQRGKMKEGNYKSQKDIIKSRKIRYAAHKDSLIYSWYSHLLSCSYENWIQKENLDKHVLAYRTRKTTDTSEDTIDYAKEVFNFIKQQDECSAIILDVEGFFSNLDHQVLKEIWSNLLDKESKRLPEDHYNIYKSITNYSFVKKEDLGDAIEKMGSTPNHKICHPPQFRKYIRGGDLINTHSEDRGIPQGAQISAMLSNAYMFGFDKFMKELVNEKDGMYRRYSDDIMVVLPTRNKDDIEEIKTEAEDKIKEDLNLNLKDDKEESRFFYRDESGEFKSHDKDENPKKLTYLGIETNGRNEYITSSTINRFYKRVTRAVKKQVFKHFKKGVQVSRRTLYKKFTQRYQDYDYTNGITFLDYVYKAARKLNSDKISKQINDKKIIEFIKDRIEEKKSKERKYKHAIKESKNS